MNFELLRFWITLGAFAFMCGYVYEQIKGKSKIKEINKRIEFLKKIK